MLNATRSRNEMLQTIDCRLERASAALSLSLSLSPSLSLSLHCGSHCIIICRIAVTCGIIGHATNRNLGKSRHSVW